MKWKKTAQIKDELAHKRWRDDTLSPLSEQPYWELCSQMIDASENVQSILFAKSVPGALIQKKFVFIITDNGLFYRSDYGGFISKPKKVEFKNLKVNFFKDKYLPSFIYVDFYFSVWKKFNLATFDPTGVQHFQNALSKKQI